MAKLVPTMPLHLTLAEAMKISPQAARRCTTSDQRVETLIDTATQPGGHAPEHLHPRRGRGDHGAARSTTMCPLARNDETVVTQYTMTTIEELGPSENGLSGPAQPDGDSRTPETLRPQQRRPRLSDPKKHRMATRRPSPCWLRARLQGVFQLESAGHDRACASA